MNVTVTFPLPVLKHNEQGYFKEDDLKTLCTIEEEAESKAF